MLQLKRRPIGDRTAQEALDGFRIPTENHAEMQPPRGSIIATHWLRDQDLFSIERPILHPVYHEREAA